MKLKNSTKRGAQTGEKRGAVAAKVVRGRALSRGRGRTSQRVRPRTPRPGACGGWPARTGTPLCPAENGGEENNGACHLPRKNA